MDVVDSEAWEEHDLVATELGRRPGAGGLDALRRSGHGAIRVEDGERAATETPCFLRSMPPRPMNVLDGKG
jgi:hypothetical protein